MTEAGGEEEAVLPPLKASSEVVISRKTPRYSRTLLACAREAYRSADNGSSSRGEDVAWAYYESVRCLCPGSPVAAKATKRLEDLTSRRLNAFLRPVVNAPKRSHMVELLLHEEFESGPIGWIKDRTGLDEQSSHLTPDRVEGGFEDTPEKTTAAREEQLAQQLKKPVTLDLDHQTLGQVLETLRTQVGITLVSELSVIKEAGVRMDDSVTVHVHNMPLKNALDMNLSLGPSHLHGPGWSSGDHDSGPGSGRPDNASLPNQGFHR